MRLWNVVVVHSFRFISFLLLCTRSCNGDTENFMEANIFSSYICLEMALSERDLDSIYVGVQHLPVNKYI